MPTGRSAPLLRAEATRRVLFTAGVLLAYRLGCQIPIPGLDTDVLSRLNSQLTVDKLSIFALGVTPIFSSLLIFEFIKLVVPPLARWEAADPHHARRLLGIIYLAALMMAGMQARGMVTALYDVPELIDGEGWTYYIVVTLVAGTALLGWFADRISLRGIGFGFWLLLVTPILVNLRDSAWFCYVGVQRGMVGVPAVAAALAFVAVATALIATVGNARYDRARLDTLEPAARPAYRVSGIDFVAVWPPLFAVYISNFIVAFFSLGPGGPIHLGLMAALIAALTWLQSRGAARHGEGPGADALRPIWTVALAQIAVCVGGELLAQNLVVPFAINGSWIIVVVTLAISIRRAGDRESDRTTPA